MKQTPRLIVLGFGLAIAFGLIQLARALFVADDPDAMVAPGWLIAESGVNIAVAVSAALGVALLAERLSGTQAAGTRLAVIALCMQVVVEIGWVGVGYVALVYPESFPLVVLRVVSCASWGLGLAIALGLGLASSSWVLGVLCAVAAALTHPPWFLSHVLWGWGHWSFRTQQLLQFTPHVVLHVLLLITAVAASVHTIVVTDAAPVAPGLRRVSLALWARTLAAAVLVVGHAVGDPWLAMMPAAQLAATAIDALALVWLAAGLVRALRGSVVELPKWPIAFAVTAAVWLLGIALAQLPWRYYVMEGAPGSFGAPGVLAGYSTALALPGQLVSAALIACTLGAIATLASRRGLEPLRARARVTALIVVLLISVSVAIQSWLGYANAPIGLALDLAASGAGVVALGLSAWLLGRAAASIDHEPPARVA